MYTFIHIYYMCILSYAIGYLHKWYFARLANLPYSLTPAILRDKQVFCTVNCYDEDEEVSARQERLDHHQLERYVRI